MQINRIVIGGNLTEAPKLTETKGGSSVCELSLANNVPIKHGGEWTTKPNYVRVVTFGRLAENCSTYLGKGSPIMVDGRLDHQTWKAEDGTGRSTLKILADSVQFLPDKKDEA